MPLFDYHCTDCDQTVEVFVRGAESPCCPRCGGRRIEKLISAFAVGGGAPDPAPPAGGCGGCGNPDGPGACRFAE